MLELKAAPSQNPVLPNANAASAASGAAPAAAGESASDAASQPGLSFAALLKQHVGHGIDKKAAAAAAAADALLASQAQAAPAAESEIADPIALLAPMLAGIAVPQASDSETTDAVPVAVDSQATDAAAILIAAPAVAAPAVAAPTGPATDAPKATAQPGTLVDNLPREGEKPLPAAANIAAQAVAAAEGKAETNGAAGDSQSSFDALLSSAKEAQVLANPHAPVRAPQAATPAAASAAVATPVGAPGWGGEVGDKVVWMVGRQETRAELVLNPPQLGRIEVSLSMNGDQADATFISANASVREALENAMPRLREVLQGAGISLGQTQVGAESFRQSAEQGQSGDNPARGRGRNDEDAPHGLALGHEHASGWLKRGDGLVDTFA